MGASLSQLIEIKKDTKTLRRTRYPSQGERNATRRLLERIQGRDRSRRATMRYVVGHLAASESTERDEIVSQLALAVFTIAAGHTCSRKILNASFCASSILSLVCSIVLASTDHFCEGISSSRCGSTGKNVSTLTLYTNVRTVFAVSLSTAISGSFRMIEKSVFLLRFGT